MVLPDTESQPAPTTRRGKGPLVAGGFLLVLVAVFALGQLTTPPPEATPSTVTTIFSQPTTTALYTLMGEPFEWELLTTFENSFPTQILEFNGEVLLFTSEWVDHPTQPFATGLRVTRVDDPNATQHIAISEEVVIQQIAEFPGGLIAIGHRPDQYLGSVWTSADGFSWAEVEMPGPTSTATADGSPGNGYNSVGMVGDLIMITGYQSNSFQRSDEIQRQLSERFGDQMRTWFFAGTDATGTDFVSVQGVLGLPLGTATLEELGVESVEFEDGVQTVWTSLGGVEWVTHEFPDLQHISTPTVGPGGKALAWVYDNNGRGTIRSTTDGSSWEEVPDPPFDPMSTWWSGQVGVSLGDMESDKPGTVVFEHTADFETWETRVSPPFLGGPPEWGFHLATSGESGMAVPVYLYDWTRLEEPPPPGTLERDGFVLTLEGHMVTLSEGEHTHFRFVPGNTSDQMSDNVRFDEETVTFTDRDTGEDLVSFSMEDLDRLEASLLGRGDRGSFTAQLLVFASSDGDWVVQDISEYATEEWVTNLTIVGDRIFLTAGGDIGFGRTVRPTSVWVADLP